MPKFKVDLHVHSPASNCFYGNEDSYGEIISEAKRKNLKIIAVTDHHSSRGIEKIRLNAKNRGILVLPGAELTCRIKDVDEVFILAVFNENFSAGEIKKMLLSWRIPEKHFGSGGFVVPEDVKKIINDIREKGGLAISSRSDKTAYRQKAIPELLCMGINTFDLVYPGSIEKIFLKLDPLAKEKINFFTFSDSHQPGDVGSRFSEIELEKPAYSCLIEKMVQKR
ncbi:MAG: PHP domain-containing protein [Endomicrobiales bacterium]|nr:PHP domain-containing protein [Endomicrobiales bacterium]